MPKNKLMATVRIKIENRGGIIYISSDDIPGLWLWGRDPERVFASIIPTLQELYKYNEGLSVKVKKAPRSSLKERWFGQDKISDTFEIYQLTQVRDNTLHDRSTVE